MSAQFPQYKKLSTCFFADAQLCCTHFCGFAIEFSTFCPVCTVNTAVFNIFKGSYFATVPSLQNLCLSVRVSRPSGSFPSQVMSGCGSQQPLRSVCVSLAAAPTTTPCFRHWRRSLLLQGFHTPPYCLRQQGPTRRTLALGNSPPSGPFSCIFLFTKTAPA